MDLLDFAVANDLGDINSFFRKRESNLFTFSSSGSNKHIYYLLIRQEDIRGWRDYKTIYLKRLQCTISFTGSRFSTETKADLGGSKEENATWVTMEKYE